MNSKQAPAPGDIDTGFPPISVPDPDQGANLDPYIILLLANGDMILGCSPCVIVKFKADHELDTTFGDNGYVLIQLDQTPYSLESIDRLPDGGYILRIETVTEIDDTRLTCLALVRLTSTGQRDPDFGQDGVRLYPLPGGASLPPLLRKLYRHLDSIDIATSPNRFPDRVSGDLSVQADGTLFVLMSVKDIDAGTYRSYVLKLLGNGDIDPGFNGNGLMEPVGCTSFVAHAMVVQNDEAFVISGVYPPPGSRRNGIGFTARFNRDGSLDNTFAEDGHFIDFGPYDYTRWHFLLSHKNGNIACVGHNGAHTIVGKGLTKACTLDENGNNPSSIVARLAPNTTEDAALRTFTAVLDRAGRVVVAGRQLGPGQYTRGFLGRVNRDGHVDEHLGYKGVRIYEDFGSLDALVESSEGDCYLTSALQNIGANKIYRIIGTK
ncbi:hypothetical protein [Pseudomonas sp. DWP3-1-2]|uniref:hypothetical protein n=1 Tax=Pseudomonas sp. DWP3-1-2 TaxID=2804645 RepID=UPI003CE76000